MDVLRKSDREHFPHCLHSYTVGGVKITDASWRDGGIYTFSVSG